MDTPNNTFPCLLPPSQDEDGNMNGGILYHDAAQMGADSEVMPLLLRLMHVNIIVGGTHPPMVDVEA